MNYAKLDQYVEYLRQFPRFSSRDYLRLHRIKALLKELGRPEKKLRGFQVAGTNGKGSTVAMIDSVLRTAGFRVGSFYSPHLVSYTERFRINGRPISQSKLASLITKIKPAVDRVEKRIGDRPTWFEVITAAAALYFAEEKVAWVVFEVGLGGRLDATTALGLRYKVITEIGLDHTQILGRSLEKITREKSGIITQRNTVITDNTGTVRRIIAKRCRRTKSRLLFEPKVSITGMSVDGTSFKLTDGSVIRPVRLKFVGRQQAVNAGLVFQLLRQTIKIAPAVILRGLAKVRLEGRFQTISLHPRVVIDGAHNVPAIRNLIKNLADLNLSRRRLIVIFAAKTRKNYAAMIRLIGTRAKMLLLPRTEIPNLTQPEQLKREYPAARISPSLKDALAFARTKAGKNDMILITGSFYLIGEVLRRYQRQQTLTVDRIDDNQAEPKL